MQIEKTYKVDEYVLTLFHMIHSIYNGIGDGLPSKMQDALKNLLDLITYELDNELLDNDIIKEEYYKKVIYKGETSVNT